MNEPYLTLEACKDEIAKRYNHIDWVSLTENTGCNYRMDKLTEAAEMHSSQFRDRLKEIEADRKTAYELISRLSEINDNNATLISELRKENKHFKGILQVVHNDVVTENEEGYLISDEAFRMIDRIKW